MLRIYLLLCLLFRTGLGTDGPTDKHSPSYGDYGSRGDQMPQNNIDDLDYDYELPDMGSLHQYEEALAVLFGSNEYLSDTVYNELESATYLEMAAARFYILQAIDNEGNYSRLSSNQKENISDALDLLENTMSERRQDTRCAEQYQLIDTLIQQARKMAEILPIKLIIGHLDHLVTKPEDASSNCQSGYLVNLWREIITMSSDSDSIDGATSLDTAIEGLVQIRQSIWNVTRWRGQMSKGEVKRAANRLKLLMMLSRKRNRIFLARYLGNQEIEDLVRSVLCEELKLQLIETMLQKLASFAKSGNFTTRLFTNPEDMTTLIEMQTTLGDMTNDIAAGERLSPLRGRSTTGLPNIGEQILDSYLDLVDSAVDDKTVEIWAQMSPEEFNAKLHHLLLGNERYVGSVSDVIFLGRQAGNESYTLDKSSVSVNIQKVRVGEHNDTFTEFTYQDTIIKTDNMAKLDIAEGDDLKVYTLRYKSWSHMIREILLKHSDLEKNDTNHPGNHTRRKRMIEDDSVDEILTNKSFIGKGGVVSLSTRHNGVKRSLPVTYWIGFDNAADFDSSTIVCLSCEYLDPNTITWESRGCRIEKVDFKGITCKCNHTTNFAAFMMPAEATFKLTEEAETALKIVSMVGSFLSISGLVITLTVFYLVRHLVRNERLKAHTHLSFALLAVHIAYLLGDLLIANNVLCLLSTIISHYFLLSAFMWMLIEGIFLYLYVVQVFLRSRVDNYNWMYFVGWGIPVLVVTISAGYGIPNEIYVKTSNTSGEDKESSSSCPEGSVEHRFVNVQNIEDEPKYTQCWLSTEYGIKWAILAPAILVLLFNTGIMCKTLTICIKSLRNARMRSSQSDRLQRKGLTSSSCSTEDYASRSRTHSDSSYSLHGQPKSTARPAASPCLLQVVTDDEKTKSVLPNGDASSSLSSFENTVGQKDTPKTPLEPEDVQREPSRYHSVSGDSSKVQNSRGSVMYRNSVGKHSPRFSTKSKSKGSKMARLTSERVAFFRDAKAAVKGAIILLPILGLPWIFGFFAHLSPVITFLFVLLNSTQGIAIFVVYCVCNGEIRRAMKRRTAVRNMKHSLDGGMRRTSSTSTARSFLRFGRRRSTVTSSA